MINILTADRLNVEQTLSAAAPLTVQQGRQLYEQGATSFEHVGDQAAYVLVTDRSTTYRVTIWLHMNYVALACGCPQGHQWVICRHRVAGMLALRDHLLKHPPKIWRSVLGQAEATPGRRTVASYGPIVFSLQQRPNGWSLLPYTLPPRLFDADRLGDLEAVAQEIETRQLSREARPIRQRISAEAYPNASAETVAATNMVLVSIGPYNYNYHYAYGSNTSSFEPALAFLPVCLVYLGADTDPLQQRIRVEAEAGTLELALDPHPEGMRLSAQVTVAGRVLPLRSDATRTIVGEPLWLLIDTTLVRVSDASGMARVLLAYPELIIPQEDQDEFLDQHLLPLAERVSLRGDMIAWEDVDADPVPRLYLSEMGKELRVDLRFGYGEYELPYDKSAPDQSVRRKPESAILARIRRRPEREQEAWQALSSYGLKRGPEPGVMVLRKNTDPIDFLLHRVPRLIEDGYEVYGEEALTSARVNRNRPTISFNVSSGIDWFDIEAVVNFGDLEVSLKDIRRAVKRRERYVKLADGTIGSLPEEWLDRYRHLFALGEESGKGFRLANSHVTLIDQLLAEADRARVDEEFERRRKRLREFDSIQPQELPGGFVGELRPYQKAGYDWLHFLHDYGFGGCLADDMGTGKTIQTLAFLQSLREREPSGPASLIVVPRSLLFNWEREAARFTPELQVYLHADQSRVRDAAEFGAYDLVITTYGVMLRDIELLRSYTFHYIILDESQAIKNPLAETSKAARLLRGEHRLVLTGTPVENSTVELWSQFAFLNPGLLGNLDYFREEFVTPIERKQNEGTADFLRKMVYPFILRRTKDQVAPELPPRTERVLVSDMEPAQRKLYNKQRDYYRALLLGLIEQDGMNDARMKILEGLLRLRQICNHPRLVDPKFRGESGKFELLIETLETLRAEGHRALIFSQFVQMLSLVREALDARQIPYAYLDGQTRDRQTVVDRFQNDSNLPFFLISLKAGGVGLNLTAADYVIHIDPWWNPAVEMQASDRTHRIGQDKPVFVYKLVVRDSVEEKILQLQERKRELVEQVIGAESGVFKSLTREDVEVLFT